MSAALTERPVWTVKRLGHELIDKDQRKVAPRELRS
jgi:hypothetical protein